MVNTMDTHALRHPGLDPGPADAGGKRSRVKSGMTRRGVVHASLSTILLATPALAHPPSILSPQGQAGVTDEIVAYYKALAAAVETKDAAKLRELYAETFTHTHTSAKVDGRDARIVSLLTGEATVEMLPFSERGITIHAGGWAAAVRGSTPIKANDGKIYMIHWLQMLSRRGDDAWQLVASQATRGRELVS
jgi:ketosteroid isomerase-like protein